MTALDVHRAGDCRPDGCRICARELAGECAGCHQWMDDCTCPTLPLDEENDQ